MKVIEEVRKENFKRVTYIALCFTMILTAYMSAQNLIAQIYKQLGYDHLGQMCLFTAYTFLGLTNSVTSHFKSKITIKFGLVAGCIAYVTFILAGTFTTYCNKYTSGTGLCSTTFIYLLNILSCAFCGFGAAFLWICQAIYVDSCCDDKTRGSYNGTFWSIMQSSLLISSGLATFVLGNTDQFTYYIVLSLFGIVAITLFCFVKPSVPYPQKAEQTQTAIASNETLKEALQRFFTTLRNTKYYFLFISMFVSGITIGFFANFLSTTVGKTLNTTDVNELNQSLGYALTALAFGEILAGLTLGRLADKHNHVNLLNATIVVSELALMVTLLAFIFQSFKFAVLCGFLWGFGDTAIQTMMNAVIGSMFGGNVELFSAYRFIQSFGVMFASILAIFTSTHAPLFYLACLAAALTFLHALFFQYMGKIQPKTSKEQLLADEKKFMIEMKNI